MAEIADVTLDREIDLTLEENALATITQIDRALEETRERHVRPLRQLRQRDQPGTSERRPVRQFCIDCKRLQERSR